MTTAIAPIGARQVNHNLYVGYSDLTTIQKAVDFARLAGGIFTVVIGAEYGGSDTIAAVTGGTGSVFILDLRSALWQTYIWSGTVYAPAVFTQLGSAEIKGNLTVDKNLSVLGNCGIVGALSVDGPTQLGGGLAGPLAISGDLDVEGDFSAERGDFTSCFVEGSQVLTVADLPPAGIPYPPAGVAVSTGTAWTTPINPSDLPRLSTPNTFAQRQLFNDGINFKGTSSTVLGAIDTLVTLHNNVRFASLGPDTTHVGGFQFDGWSSDTSFGKQYAIFFNDTPSDNTKAQAIFWVPTYFAATLSTSGGMIVSSLISSLQANVLSLGASGGTSYIDAWGANPTTTGDVFLRGVSSDASVVYNLAHFDSAGTASFLSTVIAGGSLIAGNGHLRLGDRTAGGWTTGGPNINSEGVSIILNSSGAGGSIYFNLDQGGAGVSFCNGAGAVVGSVNNAGTASFNGTGSVGKGLVVTGVNPAATGPNKLAFANDSGGTGYIDVTSNSAAQAQLQVRVANADFSTYTPALIVNLNGISVTGTVSATGGKAFVMPHPLIEGKDLVHACIEGPEYGVYYRGEVTTKKGKAEVKLPDYFEALTFDDDRSVLLTQIFENNDQEFAMLMVSRVIDGKFHIVSSVPGVKVAWEVKAVRRIGVDRLAIVRDKFVHKGAA